jgi:WD40 repeat protein
VGSALSTDGKTLAIADRPVDQLFTPVTETARMFDARTGRESATWDATDVAALRFFGATLHAARAHDVVAWNDAGHVTRTLAITGKTPGVMRVYRAGRGTMHDNVPMMYDSAPQRFEAAADGTIAVGSSDSSIWVWKPGEANAVTLKPTAPPVLGDEAAYSAPIAMRFDGPSSLLVAMGTGSVVRWNLAQRTSAVVAEAKCADSELGDMWGSAPTPEQRAQCARARNATFNTDASRVMFTGTMNGPRVRDTKTGAPVASLDTLASEPMTFTDRDMAWLGSFDGTMEQWDVPKGERAGALAQGGVAGFMQSLSRDGRYAAVMERPVGFHVQSAPKVHVWDTSLERPVAGLPSDITHAQFADEGTVLLATRSRGTLLWDMTTAKPLFELGGKDETSWLVSEGHKRIVSTKGGKIVVRDARGVLREIATGKNPWALAIDRAAHTAATVDEANNLTVWNLDDGRNLLQMSVVGSVVALSPDGRSVMWRADPKEIVVTSIDDKHEIARLAAKTLAPADDYSPIRSFAFVSDTEALVVGPGAPGYARVYRWTIGGAAKATELQVLTADRIEAWPSGVAAIYDRNDTIHLLRADGVLLASVSATLGGGFIAMSRAGAVDAPDEGRSATITIADKNVMMGRSSWLGWDRFAVPMLLGRAARGELVSPPMPALLERSDTLRHATR